MDVQNQETQKKILLSLYSVTTIQFVLLPPWNGYVFAY